jgi:4Fe-4S ferredoxin
MTQRMLVVGNLRGQSIKQENLREITIERNFLTQSYLLRLNRDLCNGCGICFEVCPHEAIKMLPATVHGGHLVEKATIDFDVDSCVLCGECAVLCPLNALTMEVGGEETATIVENEAFPVLLKEVTVTKEKCSPECGIKCQEACPTEALKVSTKLSENAETVEITDVQIDESSCIYCKRCELSCTQDAIVVQKPFMGRIELHADVCPDGCDACVDVCSSHAIRIENGKPVVSDQFCIFCSACETVCPQEAIKIHRDWIFHTDIKAAAWLTALKKLTSPKTVAKELRIKSGKRRADLVQARTSSNNSTSNPVPCTKAEEFLKILNTCKK